jgi:hypothetical protein
VGTELVKAIAPAAAAVIAVVAAAWQYRNSKREEFRKRFWEEQYALYSKAVNAAAAIAVGSDLDSTDRAREEFWRLYWGALSMIEDPEVEGAMINFGRTLSECEAAERLAERAASGDTPTELRVAAYKLAHSMRESLSRTWQPVDLGKLKDRRPLM